MVNLEPARRIVQVEERAAALLRDHAHGLVDDFAAAAVGAEDVPRGAARVHANQHRVFVHDRLAFLVKITHSAFA